MKVCTKCGHEKEEVEFFMKNKAKGILHSNCKDCKREIDRVSYKSNSKGRKEKVRKNASSRAKELRLYIENYRKSCSCKKCGDVRYYVLDFHHLTDKKYNICAMASKGVSQETLDTELKKCIVLCANCHRELHHFERMGDKANLVEATD